MKRAKDKYMINRTKYKDIKRYDHQQMEDFLTDVYKNGYADGKESVPGVELQDVEKALQDGSIQGYLSAKQTLKIIERIKARESPR